jgi:hypothetical protein
MTVDELPNLTGSWGTHVSGFMNDGRWLLGDVNEALTPLKNAMTNTIRQGLVKSIQKPQQFFVFINTGKSEADCPDRVGGIYMSQYGGCVDFWYNMGRWSSNKFYANAAADEKMNDLKGEVGGSVNLEAMYTNAIECAIKYGTSDQSVGDSSAWPSDGSYPDCFFNYPVFKGWGSWKGGVGKWMLQAADNGPLSTITW